MVSYFGGKCKLFCGGDAELVGLGVDVECCLGEGEGVEEGAQFIKARQLWQRKDKIKSALRIKLTGEGYYHIYSRFVLGEFLLTERKEIAFWLDAPTHPACSPIDGTP